MEISIRAIDLGFDIRALGIPVMLKPEVARVRYESLSIFPEDRQPLVAEGSYDAIVQELAAAGYDLVVDQTPNGRTIRFNRKTGEYEVQPHNDNYWISCNPLEEAHEAYNHPERFI